MQRLYILVDVDKKVTAQLNSDVISTDNALGRVLITSHLGNVFMNKHKITTKLIIGSLLLVSIPMMVPAETLSQILTAQTERTLLAQESQVRVDKIR